MTEGANLLLVLHLGSYPLYIISQLSAFANNTQSVFQYSTLGRWGVSVLWVGSGGSGEGGDMAPWRGA